MEPKNNPTVLVMCQKCLVMSGYPKSEIGDPQPGQEIAIQCQHCRETITLIFQPTPPHKGPGRPKAFDNPQHVWELFLQYKAFCKDNPFLVRAYVGKDGDPVWQEKERPLTWDGFDCFVLDRGIINDLEDYRINRNGAYDEFSGVISRINKVIREDKFGGAAAGVFNHNIIARDLGLVDKKEQNVVFEQPLFGPEEDESNNDQDGNADNQK